MFAPSQLELLPAASVPALLAPDARAKARTLEFFTAHIRNPNTRKAYARAGQHFGDWCARFGIDGGSGFGRVAVVMIVVVVLMIMRMLSGVPCDRLRMTAATATAGGFRLGVVVDRQGGGEIGFHASIQNPEEASGSSPIFP